MCDGDHFAMADIDFSPRSAGLNHFLLHCPSHQRCLHRKIFFSKAISAEIKLTRARFDDEAIFDGEILALK